MTVQYELAQTIMNDSIGYIRQESIIKRRDWRRTEIQVGIILPVDEPSLLLVTMGAGWVGRCWLPTRIRLFRLQMGIHVTVRCDVDRNIATAHARWGQGNSNLCTLGSWITSMRGGSADKVRSATPRRTELDVVSRTIRGGVYIFTADDWPPPPHLRV